MAGTYYGTVAGADEYFSARGNAAWAGYDNSAKEAALLIASEWIDGRYRGSFPGLKVGQRDQVREWPRSGASDINGYAIDFETVPDEVINATYEVAAKEAATPGSLYTDVTVANAIRKVAVEGAVSVEYAGGASVYDYQISLPAVDMIIGPVLTGSASGSSLAGTTYLTR